MAYKRCRVSEENFQFFLKEGQRFFSKGARFSLSASDPDHLPRESEIEIAFIGRSNVGKSSLINALTNNKKLAYVAKAPGRTQTLNYYQLLGMPSQKSAFLVDLPGYGYAATSQKNRHEWADFFASYVRGRSSLARAYLLLDSRIELKTNDREMMDFLDKHAISYQIILTKGDKIPLQSTEVVISQLMKALQRRPALYPNIILTSSESGMGIDRLRGAIVQLFIERGFLPYPSSEP
jgi:GTP-binding protein